MRFFTLIKTKEKKKMPKMKQNDNYLKLCFILNNMEKHVLVWDLFYFIYINGVKEIKFRINLMKNVFYNCCCQ